ncbi:choice-of-anchor D domain-containing protein, partial [Bacteroidota bacterium]|nr:choice-of-anchor D domain-containing protein [Bacteroidota bacterium]
IFSLIIALSAFAQTGVGVTTNTSSPYSFTATNVDSTTTQSITLVNTVAAPQTVSLSGLSAPFSASQSTLTIPASDSISFDISFNPTTTGNFSDTLDWNGSIFGNGSLVVDGEGVQVILTSSTDSLNLGTISLGTSVTDSFMLSNTGTGTMIISNISSSSPYFSVNPTSGSLSQGSNMYVSVTFSPLMSGLSNSTLSIESNDPNTPVYNVNVQGTSVSEISGALCGTLSLANSPYTLVGDITVADTCVLTIEAGVEIYGSSYGLYVDGTLNAVGTASDSIKILTDEIILANANGHDSLSFISTHVNGFDDGFEINNLTSNWSTNGNTNNMTRSTAYSNSDDFDSDWGGYFRALDVDQEYISQPFICVDNDLIISWDYRNAHSDTYCSVEFKYRVNGGVWQTLVTSSNSSSNWFNESHDVSSNITIGDNVEFMIYCNVYNSSNNYDEQTVYLDNFAFNSSTDKMIISNKESVNLSNSTILSKMLVLSASQDKDDFDDCTLPTGWSNNGYVHVSPGNGVNGCGVRLYANGSDVDLTTSSFAATSTNTPISVLMRMSKSEQNCYAYIHYDINGSNSWTQLSAINGTRPWTSFSYNIPSNEGDSIRLRFKADMWTSSTYGNEQDLFIDDLYILNGYDTTFINNSNIKSTIYNYQELFIDSCNLFPISSENLINTLGDIHLNNSVLSGNVLSTSGIYSSVADRDIRLFNSTIKDFTIYGIHTDASNSKVFLQYSFVKDNGNTGIYTSHYGSDVNLNSSMVTGNGNYGIESAGQVNTNYSNITFNTNDGINLNGNNFSNIKNSIIWGNDIYNYTQINTNSGITSITYSTVQGSGAYGTSGGQYYFGDGSIDDDPVFADPEQHMSNFSNCVDAGTHWETDANMPYGLGGVRADIGIYGGPDNWFWGGTPVPDGSPLLTSIEDSPQDQGGFAGVLFDKSIWDNSSLINNVTHYSIWRHYDVIGLSIDSIDNGNWERMGSIPAQSFNAYAYTSETLGDSNLISGMFNSCFVVVAHTADSANYWYSNVLCGYSVDNLAPSVPLISARIDSLSSGVLVHWSLPNDDDYSYSNVYSLSGFSALGVIDTSALDLSTLPGGTYTYGVVHYDVNGNNSDTAWVTITIDDNEDIIPLKAGWNLISSNKIPLNNTMQDIFGDLIPGNLVYVTGFNQGSSLYNPNGLPFLNTLTQFDQGYGYWVKVNQADTLRIIGNNIPSNSKINLNAGWNLSGYMNPASSTPQQYLGDLISANNLLYCTGFDQGTQLFNPNGLPFLNTLNTMQRPFGYWIKVNNPVGSSQYRLTNESGNYFSPEYMFINGKMNLDGFDGNTINVYNSNNDKLAEMLVLKEGYLMTTPIYGDDPQTSYSEGFIKGENLIFELNGMIFESDITFEPNMELKQINLEFDENSVWNIYPNPTNSLSTISFDVNGETNVSVKVFDLSGKLLDIVVDGNYNIGNHSLEWNPINYDKGVYIFKIYFDQVEISSERVVLN